MKVKKAIIAAAGFGTRMLPQTKATPKEMLPILNKPVIQYIVEEVVEAGIEDIIIVTGYHKRSIEDHFDHTFQLYDWLKKSKKIQQLEEIKKIADSANFIYIRQKDNGYGNAIPLKVARPIIGEEPFLLLWGDIIADPGRSLKALKAFEKYQSPIFCAVHKEKPEDFDRYGYIEGKQMNDEIWEIEEMIEKPGKKGSKTNLAVMNGYVFTPQIYKYIDKLQPNAKGEYCVIDAINKMCKDIACYGMDMGEIKQYDTGNKQDYIKTNLEFALKDKELKKEILDFLKQNKF